VVIIVIVPIIGNNIELVEPPTSAPPLATTSASSPPEEDRPNADLSEVTRLIFCVLAAIVTVKNLATMDTIISIREGIMNVGRTLKSIKAPTETKNIAANMSFNGVANILVTEWTFDSAINTPAKNAPVQFL